MRKTCVPCGAKQNVVVVDLSLCSSFEAHFLMNQKRAPSSFRRTSLNHDVSTSPQGEQLGRLIDRWRCQLMPSMLTYPTSNDRNFLSSGWFFSKKASTFRVKKALSIDILFLQTRENNNGNLPTGRSSAAEDRFQRPQESKITTMHLHARGQRWALWLLIGTWLSYRPLHTYFRRLVTFKYYSFSEYMYMEKL